MRVPVRKLVWLIIKLFLLINIYKKVPMKKLVCLNSINYFLKIFTRKFEGKKLFSYFFHYLNQIFVNNICNRVPIKKLASLNFKIILFRIYAEIFYMRVPVKKFEWLIIKLFLLNNIFKKVPSKKLARLNLLNYYALIYF